MPNKRNKKMEKIYETENNANGIGFNNDERLRIYKVKDGIRVVVSSWYWNCNGRNEKTVTSYTYKNNTCFVKVFEYEDHNLFGECRHKESKAYKVDDVENEIRSLVYFVESLHFNSPGSCNYTEENLQRLDYRMREVKDLVAQYV